jgi:hypothetical protein
MGKDKNGVKRQKGGNPINRAILYSKLDTRRCNCCNTYKDNFKSFLCLYNGKLLHREVCQSRSLSKCQKEI